MVKAIKVLHSVLQLQRAHQYIVVNCVISCRNSVSVGDETFIYCYEVIFQCC